MKFSNNLKSLRKKNQIKQAELADFLGTTRSAISNYERGDRVPTIEFFIQLAQHFEVSLDYLILGKSFIKGSEKVHDELTNEIMAENLTLMETQLQLKQEIEDLNKEIAALKRINQGQEELLQLYR